MNQPFNDPYSNAPTENTSYSLPHWSKQVPGNPQQPSSPNYRYPPVQGPTSQPGFSSQNFPPTQRSASQPGFSSQNYPQQTSGPTYPGQPPAQVGNYPSSQGPASHLGQPPRNSPPVGGYLSPQGQEQPGRTPSWPHPSQPPQAPKQSKKGLIAIISISIVLVLILGGVGGALALRSKNTLARPGTPTARSTPATQPSGETTPSTGTNGSVGQAIQAGPNWVVIVTRVRTTTASDFPPKAGYTYLEITLTLKNVSATRQIVASLLQFTLSDTNGKKYNEAQAILNDTNIQRTPDGTVNFGQTLGSQLPYLVPQSTHIFILAFDYDLIEGGSSAITWQLSV